VHIEISSRRLCGQQSEGLFLRNVIGFAGNHGNGAIAVTERSGSEIPRQIRVPHRPSSVAVHDAHEKNRSNLDG
jgi:hypothetical protein